jgi:predicted acyl esterase
MEQWVLDHAMDDQAHRDRSTDLSKVKVPVLSTANWGGQGLHTRGNFEGFVGAASPEKWLEAHGGAHWESFYTNKGMALQKKFFGHYLKGEATGWMQHPRVQLQVRHVDKFVERDEAEWPLARTQWTRFYLDPSDCSLRTTAPRQSARLEYQTQGDGLLFLSAPLREAMEVTGPAAARLVVSSATSDADLFLALRVFTGDGREITFQGSNDPRTPIGLGWLRASHRKLDPSRSLPYRPFHTHDEVQPLLPGQPVPLDIEIWPTSIVIPAGYRFGLSVRGKDYHYPGEPLKVAGFKYSLTGVGPFLHHHARDRPAEVFHTANTLHFDEADAPYLPLPVIPAARS